MSDGTPRRHLGWLLMVTRAIIVAAFSVMIAITFLQVGFRYLLTAPLPWSEEAARYCFVWIVFLGAALGVERGVHLGVDLLVNRLPPTLQRMGALICDLLIASFALTVIYASVPVLRLNALQHSPALGLPMSWIYAAIPISMTLIFAITVGRILRQARALRA